MFGIGQQEIQQILISVLAISLAFTIASTRGENVTAALFALLFIVIIISVGLGFTLHEMGHRFVARRYGAYAVYQMWPQGLMFALATSFLGFVFAAPGAVYIMSPYISRRQNGIISIAGPLMNIALSFAFFVLGLFAAVAAPGNSFMGTLVYYGVSVNMLLAFFNLIPIFPLDGSKVLAWNPPLWLAFFAFTGIFDFFVIPLLFA